MPGWIENIVRSMMSNAKHITRHGSLSSRGSSYYLHLDKDFVDLLERKFGGMKNLAADVDYLDDGNTVCLIVRFKREPDFEV